MTNPMPRRNPHIPRSPTRSDRKGVRGSLEDSSSPQPDCTKNAGEPISERRYDVVIVDEASMAYMPHLFWAACLSRHKLVIVGDFRQLGPVVKTRQPRAQELLKRDAFQAAGLVTDDIVWVNDPRMASLRLQHRMHPEI